MIVCRNTILLHSMFHNALRRLGLITVSLSIYIAGAASANAQDWIKTGTGLGVEKIRIAVTDFKASSQDPKNTELLKTFNDTLWNDLSNAGIFEMVSKSFYPLGQVGGPSDVKFESWSAPPPNAAMLVFGNMGASANTLTMQGWLYDVKNTQSPQVPTAQPRRRPESSPINLPTRLFFAWAAESTG
jgi:TolB protein